MASFVPNTAKERAEMLAFIGVKDIDSLYGGLPAAVKRKEALNIPGGGSELEVRRKMQSFADKNKVFKTVFRGAGAYRHYIPSIVKAVTSKEKFVTAYTPYQPEISQGVLQSIFEYQTMICELTGMDGSNASVYDGAVACAEAVSMCADKKRGAAYISAAVNPEYLSVVETYCRAAGRKLEIIPEKDGVTGAAFLMENLKEDAACVIVQQPNFHGLVEDADALGRAAHAAGAKFVMCVNPFYAAIGKTPGECGADIAVGEGQPLGLPLSYGGPYLGFMACREALVRKLPGRIVGQTKDIAGKRAFVLTMQAREQHIRREKAASNICSNQALCAMTAACYMTAMGAGGMREAAYQCLSKARYAANNISAIDGFELVYKGECFHEFETRCPVDTNQLMEKLEEHGILGGLPTENGILWCMTEMNTKEEIDELVKILAEQVRHSSAVKHAAAEAWALASQGGDNI